MKTVRGVKVLDMQEDVLGNLGKIDFCRMVEEKIRGGYKGFKDLYNFTIDTSNITNMPKPYKMIFIPVHLLEEKLVLDAMKELQETKEDLISNRSICEVTKIYLRQKNRVEKVEATYNPGNIKDTRCVMILYSNDTLIDVRIMYPAEALDIFEKHKISTYNCSICHKDYAIKNDGTYRPEPGILYEDKDGKTLYYCRECTNKKLNHLGE